MRAGILRILPISRAGGTPLPMAGRLTQLAKIFPFLTSTMGHPNQEFGKRGLINC